MALVLDLSIELLWTQPHHHHHSPPSVIFVFPSSAVTDGVDLESWTRSEWMRGGGGGGVRQKKIGLCTLPYGPRKHMPLIDIGAVCLCATPYPMIDKSKRHSDKL